MISFKDFIAESDEFTHLYHGTSDETAKTIQQHGFDPGKSKYANKIYMTTNAGLAQKYSKNAKGVVGTVLKIKAEGLKKEHLKKESSGIYTYEHPIEPHHISKAF